MGLDASERVLVRLALLARVAVLSLALLAQVTLLPLPWSASSAEVSAAGGGSSFPSHYDASAQLFFRRACPTTSAFDQGVVGALGWQAHWDGLHFLEALPALRATTRSGALATNQTAAATPVRLAQTEMEGPSAWWIGVGYEVEKESAFGLGWPAALNLLATPTHSTLSLVGIPSCPLSALLLASGALSLLLLVANTLLLHRLSLAVLGPAASGGGHTEGRSSRRLAFLSSVCFIFSPAALFHAACYSEALFTFLSLAGMLLYQRSRDASCSPRRCWGLLAAAAAFALASTVRANGWLLAGFFAFDALQRTAQARRSGTDGGWSQRAAILARVWVSRALLCLLTLAPFVLQQGLLARRFCASELVQPKPAYCDAHWMPSVYAHVQSKYWNVGWFRYYELRQLPNFLFALPVWALSLAGICEFARTRPAEFFSLGLRPDAAPLPPPPPPPRYPLRPRARPPPVNVPFASGANETIPGQAAPSAIAAPAAALDASWATARALPFVYLWCLLFGVCVCVLHVQVSTRFLSACPAQYWFTASLLAGLRPPRRALHTCCRAEAAKQLAPTFGEQALLSSTAAATWLCRWSVAFVLLGGTLFPAFLPWT